MEYGANQLIRIIYWSVCLFFFFRFLAASICEHVQLVHAIAKRKSIMKPAWKAISVTTRFVLGHTSVILFIKIYLVNLISCCSTHSLFTLFFLILWMYCVSNNFMSSKSQQSSVPVKDLNVHFPLLVYCSYLLYLIHIMTSLPLTWLVYFNSAEPSLKSFSTVGDGHTSWKIRWWILTYWR